MRNQSGFVYVYLAVAIGAVAAITGAYFTGRSAGADAAQAKWLAQHSADLAVANQKLREAYKEKETAQRWHAEESARLSQIHQAQIEVTKNERDRLLARNRSLGVRVRGCRNTGGSNTGEHLPKAGTGAAGSDGGAASVLSTADGDFLIRFAADADRNAKQLAACQALVKADRGL